MGKLHYRICPKYRDGRSCANSVNPGQTPQNAASDQGLHCLPLIQQAIPRLVLQFFFVGL